MATLDQLPADQRAVLQLVLQRGRSYDDIAAMLSIDRAAVRERALGALDAIGPESDLEPVRRGLITDYLLGQLPTRVAGDVRSRLAGAPDERAWARVVAAELAPLAREPLPEIPSPATAQPKAATVPASASEPERPAPSGPHESHAASRATRRREGAGIGGPRSSRRGGAILLGGGLLAVVIVVIVVIASSGGSSHSSSTAASVPASSSTNSTATTSSSSATSSARPVAQVNLTSPTGSKTVGGVAIVVRQGAQEGLVIRAQGIPANSAHDAYAVWLTNPSGAPSQILGFVNPGVGKSGVLQTAGALPAGAARYKQLDVTLETQAKPKSPGKVILQGALNVTG